MVLARNIFVPIKIFCQKIRLLNITKRTEKDCKKVSLKNGLVRLVQKKLF